MELMESRWTDDRMDDLKHQVEGIGRRMDEGFAELRDELRAHRRDMDARFERVDERFEKIDERFEKVDVKIDAKFDALQDQIARTHETVIGLYAMLSRFSLWFAGAMAVTFVSVLLTLWLR
jgi:ferric iron reductase protein FhuF